MSEWIKCSERLPDEKVEVLTWDGDEADIGYRFRNFWNLYIGHSEPTHWMPLPAPPAEDE